MKRIFVLILSAAGLFAQTSDLTTGQAARLVIGQRTFTSQDTNSSDQIVGAVDAVKMVDDSLVAIATDVEEVHKLLGTMTEDNRVQSLAVTEITTAISAMDQATQQNAAMVEQTSAAARNMTNEVQGLADSAAQFVIEPARRDRTIAAKLPARISTAPHAKANGKVETPALPAHVAASSKPARAAADSWNAF